MPKERFEKMCKIGFPFSSCQQKSLVEGVEVENPTEKASEAFVTPDVATSSAVSVVPQIYRSTGYSLRRRKGAEADDGTDDETEEDITEEEEEEAETEDDATEGDDNDDEEHDEDAADGKAPPETSRRNYWKEKRRSAGSLRVTRSAVTKMAAGELIPDSSVSCAVVRFSNSPNAEESSNRVQERNWSCEKCGKKGFQFFVQAMNHEARCLGLQSLEWGFGMK